MLCYHCILSRPARVSRAAVHVHNVRHASLTRRTLPWNELPSAMGWSPIPKDLQPKSRNITFEMYTKCETKYELAI